MASTDISNLKKRLKRSIKPAEEVPDAPVPDAPHKELTAFLRLLFEKNYFQKPAEGESDAFTAASTLAPLDKALEEVKASQHPGVYLEEIFRAYTYLQGFPQVPQNPSFLLATLALWAAADSSDRAVSLVRDVAAFPDLESALNKAPQLFHFDNDLVTTAVIQAYNHGAAQNPTAREVQLVLAAVKVTKHKPTFLLKLQPRNRVLDGLVFSRVLFGLGGSQLPPAEGAVLERLIQLTWLAHRGCRRSSLKFLVSYYLGLDPESPLAQKDTPLAREIASLLYFNKLSYKSYEDDDLIAAFNDFWQAFGSSNVKSLLLQGLSEIRRQYFRLFAQTVEDVAGHPESLEVQADNHLLQRCIFIALWEMHTRMDQAAVPAAEMGDMIQFLEKVLAVNTKQLDWTYTTPKIKQILIKLTAKEDFAAPADHLERLVEALVTASAAFPADIKTRALREVAKEFAQEKHGFVYGKAVVKIYEMEANKLPVFPLLFALESLAENDPNRPGIEALARDALKSVAHPTEDLVKQLIEFGNFDSLKSLVADQLIEQAESVAQSLQDDQKKPLIESLVAFALPFFAAKLPEVPAEETPQSQAIVALRGLLPPSPEPTEAVPEESGAASPSPKAD